VRESESSRADAAATVRRSARGSFGPPQARSVEVSLGAPRLRRSAHDQDEDIDRLLPDPTHGSPISGPSGPSRASDLELDERRAL